MKNSEMELKNYLMITSLKIITAGPPYPWDLRKPQIENIWRKKKISRKFPKPKLEFATHW